MPAFDDLRKLCKKNHFSFYQWWSQGHKPQGHDQGLQNCPRGWGLVLEDSNTGKHRIKCFGEALNTLHIYSVIGNGTEFKLLPLKSFVQNMQWLVKSVSSSFSKDLSHEAKDSARKAKAIKNSTLKAKTKDFKIVLEDEDLSSRTPTLASMLFYVILLFVYSTINAYPTVPHHPN